MRNRAVGFVATFLGLLVAFQLVYYQWLVRSPLFDKQTLTWMLEAAPQLW